VEIEVPPLDKSLSTLSFGDTKLETGYIFSAASNLLAPKVGKKGDVANFSKAIVSLNSKENVKAHVRPTFEAPDPTIAAAFLARTASRPAHYPPTSAQLAMESMPVVASQIFDVALPDAAVLQRFAADLIPYYLCQYELEGIAVTAHPIPHDLPSEARKAAKATPMGSIPEFESLAIDVMKQARPSLAGLDAKDVKLEMRSMAEVLKLACDARLTNGRTEVPLSELMYDDAFVHGLVVWLC
jgi:hypothetical protein